MRTALTEKASEGAIGQFALNLKPLLMQPPVKGKVTMGLDPGYRMGCKVAVVDGTGKVLDTAVVYPTHGPRQREEAITRLSQLVRKHEVEHIAIGNGTASRETEQAAVELIRRLGEFISIIGISGCGKSTIFKLTNGLLKRKSGNILLNGQDIASVKHAAGYMPQKDLLFPWRTVGENVALPLAIKV